MSMEDQGLLSEPPLPVDLRPCQGTRCRSTRGLDEKHGQLTCQSSSPAASPMDIDDHLSEILLHLTPLPSSLPRASLVCTRWRRLVTDPSFLRRFRAHHWKPLGVFFGRDKGLSFSFFLGPWDSAPPERFSVRVPRECHEGGGGRADCVWEFLDCRHGRVVLANYATRQILVWNPVTGEDLLLGVSQFADADEILMVWEKATEDPNGVFQWMLGGTIELDMLLSLRSEGHRSVLWLEGNDNVIFVSTYKGIFMVHLQSMQFERIFETGPVGHWYILPFKYPHAPGDILHQGGVGCGRVQGSGQGHGEDRADRWVLHASTKDGGAHGLKRGDAHVSWEGRGPTW